MSKSLRNPSEAAKAYDQDEIAQYFTGRKPGTDGNNFYLGPIVMHFLREHFRTSSDLVRYLEIGSGGGQILAQVVTELKVSAATIVEPSNAMMQSTLTQPDLRHAVERGLTVYPHLAPFQEALAQSLLPDGGYDAVVSLLVAEFMVGLESEEHPERLEAYVYELLKKVSPNGILVLADVVNPVEENNIVKLIYQSLRQISQTYAQVGLAMPWKRILTGLKFYKVNVEEAFVDLNTDFYNTYHFSNEDWQRLAEDLRIQGYTVDLLNMGLQVKLLTISRKS